METEQSFFDNLAQEIDWNTPFQAEQTSMLEGLKTEGPGNDRLRKLENLLAIGKNAAQYIDMQEAAARMRDGCCTPELASMFGDNNALGEYAPGRSENHGDCDDDHSDQHTTSKDTKKKKKTGRQYANGQSIADLLAKYWKANAAQTALK